MSKVNWNPDLYLKFDKERIQPSIDLVSRIDMENPTSIIDIGCGPGNSTQILKQRWPQSKIVGIDNSQAMIDKARRDYPDQEWKLVDAEKDQIEGSYDIIFSNATIQWIPNHAGLLHKLKNNLNEGGVIAVQLPLFFDMPLGKSIAQISKEPQWADRTQRVNALFTIHSYAEYYDILSSLFTSLDIWVTHYVHVMQSYYTILEMIRSTGLRPYLDKLKNNEEKAFFEEKVLSDISRDYPIQKNGNVLFPFDRIFFIAKK